MLPLLAFQTYEIVLIVLVVFILFGGVTQIPKMARALGRAKGEYQVARKDFESEVARAEHGAAATAAPSGTQAPTTTPADPEEVRRAAREMGIATEGRSIEELKADIGRRLA